MKLIRSEKEFTKDNMPNDFVTRAYSLAGKHSSPLKWNEQDYKIIEQWKGIKPGGSVFPWKDEFLENGYKKIRSGVNIKTNRGFDTDIIIFENGSIQGYYKETHNSQYAANPIEWCNLLLEYEFLKIE